MGKYRAAAALAALLALTGGGPGVAYQIALPGELHWVRDGGVLMAVLSGDPYKSGPFVIRLKMSDGYRVMPHWHPRNEGITVIQGTFLLGTGSHFNPAGLKPMPMGAYVLIPKNLDHFASCTGETIIQLQGEGPWVSNYVNPADKR